MELPVSGRQTPARRGVEGPVAVHRNRPRQAAKIPALNPLAARTDTLNRSASACATFAGPPRFLRQRLRSAEVPETEHPNSDRQLRSENAPGAIQLAQTPPQRRTISSCLHRLNRQAPPARRRKTCRTRPRPRSALPVPALGTRGCRAGHLPLTRSPPRLASRPSAPVPACAPNPNRIPGPIAPRSLRPTASPLRSPNT
jgi:hypothetical protein